jgi:hypothetical protein
MLWQIFFSGFLQARFCLGESVFCPPQGAPSGIMGVNADTLLAGKPALKKNCRYVRLMIWRGGKHERQEKSAENRFAEDIFY